MILYVLGSKWAIFGVGVGLKTALGSTHVVKLSFVRFRQFWYLIFTKLGSFLTFWGPNGLFLGWGRVRKLFWVLLM